MSEQTPTVGLFGTTIARSLSPAMQGAAFAAYGLDEEYALWSIEEAELPARVRALRVPPMRGANVTIPYKSAVLAMVDDLGHDPDVAALGALNTIVRRPNGRLLGLNTDVAGFMLGLRAGGCEPSGAHVVLLGAGGAARAVAWGLLGADIASLTIVNRTAERARRLADGLAPLNRTRRPIEVLAADDPTLEAVVKQATLMVNSTSVGADNISSPLDIRLLHPDLHVSDLLYRTTPLLRAAQACGAWTQDGLEMLVRQGALAFEAWTDRAAPVDVMRNAALQAREQQQ
jgi:shikimate dehydrogenase